MQGEDVEIVLFVCVVRVFADVYPLYFQMKFTMMFGFEKLDCNRRR